MSWEEKNLARVCEHQMRSVDSTSMCNGDEGAKGGREGGQPEQEAYTV
jgi:hypothetical protein